VAGRKSKYTEENIAKLVELLEQGNTDIDSCSLVGISQETFYTWIKDKPEFSERVTHARSKARRAAVASWRQGMLPTTVTEDIIDTFSETRINPKTGETYTYTRTTKRKKVVNQPADWRAAEAYLKRRDPDNWSEKIKNEHSGEGGSAILLKVVYDDNS
jgi:hypothetical protein